MSSPLTPVRTSATTSSSPPTGSWRHPLMDEVSRRQAESSFTDACFYTVAHNLAALVVSFLLGTILGKSDQFVSFTSFLPTVILTYSFYLLWAIRLLFIFNSSQCLWRLLRPADDFSDIALTPVQRKLLGLKPDTPLSASVRPDQFITPPRYPKSTPPSIASSPLLGNSSPTMQRRAALGRASSGIEYKPQQDTTSPQDSPIRQSGGQQIWVSPCAVSPKNVGMNSVTPSSRWAYEKSILHRKSDGIHTSPNKNLFGNSTR